MRWALGISALWAIAVTVALVEIKTARFGSGNNLTHIQLPSQKLVVQEWGTFTSFSGSDGVKLEFRPLVENDLPEFVLNRASQSGLRNPFGKINMSVLHRIETPVTYFYTEVPREVTFRVGFPQGLLTEFYPPVDNMLPAYGGDESETMTDSELDWGTIGLIPENHFRAYLGEDQKLAGELEANMLKRMLPTFPRGNPYAEARLTDSAIIYKKPVFEKDVPFPKTGFLEKFLFYRGVGNFSLPLTLAAQSDDQYELTNSGDQAIRGLFLVTVKEDRVWFKQYPEILPGNKLTMEQATMSVNMNDLAKAMEASLTAEGLYPKEALAMVNTWRHSWFGEEGTRLFYLLPQSKTDELLPLEVKPTPDEVLRVMVGRLEIMRPEDEELVWGIVIESMQARKQNSASQDAQPARSSAKSVATPHKLPPALLKLGRLAEPALVRVKNINTDLKLQAEADMLLEEIRAYRSQMAHSEL